MWQLTGGGSRLKPSRNLQGTLFKRYTDLIKNTDTAIHVKSHVARLTGHNNHIIKQLRKDAGGFGHFLPLSAISSDVSGQILTKSGMEIPVGLESIILKSDLQNSKRLPWKSGNKTQKGRMQAASDTFSKQPRTLFPSRQPQTLLLSSLGHFPQAASDTFSKHF